MKGLIVLGILAVVIYLLFIHDWSQETMPETQAQMDQTRQKLAEMQQQTGRIQDPALKKYIGGVVSQSLQDLTTDEELKRRLATELKDNKSLVNASIETINKQISELQRVVRLLEGGEGFTVNIPPAIDTTCNAFEDGGFSCVANVLNIEMPPEFKDMDVGALNLKNFQLTDLQRKNRVRIRQFLMDKIEELASKLRKLGQEKKKLGEAHEDVAKSLKDIDKARYKNLMAMILLRYDQEKKDTVPLYYPLMLNTASYSGTVKQPIAPVDFVQFVEDPVKEVRSLGNIIFTASKDFDRLTLIEEEEDAAGKLSKWKYFYPVSMHIPELDPGNNPEYPIYSVLDNFNKIDFQTRIADMRRIETLQQGVFADNLVSLSFWAADKGRGKNLVPIELGAGEIHPNISSKMKGYALISNHSISVYLILDGGKLKMVV